MEGKGGSLDNPPSVSLYLQGRECTKAQKAKILIKFPSFSKPIYKTRLSQSLPKSMFPDFLIVKKGLSALEASLSHWET